MVNSYETTTKERSQQHLIIESITESLNQRQPLMSIVDYFAQTRIINIVARKDRREETEREFGKHGFPVNSRQVRFFEAIRPSEADRFPNIGVKGCFLSHMKILKHAHDTDAQNVLIVEDDVAFSKHITRYGKIAIEALDELSWDIVYFGHSMENDADGMGWKVVSEPINLAHCYAVNRRAIKPLYDFLELLLSRPEGHPKGGPMHYDGALYTFIRNSPSVKAYYYSYNLAYQRPSRTDLHDLKAYDRNKYLRPVIRLLRRVKSIYLGISRTILVAALFPEVWSLQWLATLPIK